MKFVSFCCFGSTQNFSNHPLSRCACDVWTLHPATLCLCTFYFLSHELESLKITHLYAIQIFQLRERDQARSYNWNWIKHNGMCLYFIHCVWFIEEEETLKLFCLWATLLWSWSTQWGLLDAIHPEMCHWSNENWSDRRHKLDPDWNYSIRCCWAFRAAVTAHVQL